MYIKFCQVELILYITASGALDYRKLLPYKPHYFHTIKGSQLSVNFPFSLWSQTIKDWALVYSTCHSIISTYQHLESQMKFGIVIIGSNNNNGCRFYKAERFTGAFIQRNCAVSERNRFQQFPNLVLRLIYISDFRDYLAVNSRVRQWIDFFSASTEVNLKSRNHLLNHYIISCCKSDETLHWSTA